MTAATTRTAPPSPLLCAAPKRLLIVTTVPQTLEAFLLPYAEHFRGAGWTVDALARGASTADAVVSAFDVAFDIEWSRNPVRALQHIKALEERVREVVTERQHDIVHVHTPVASFVTRYALRGLRSSGGPAVVYTAHGFHFHSGGGRLRNAAFASLEKLAGRWTDRLVLINQEDVDQAHRFGIVPPDRVHPMPGIGVDIEGYVTRAEEGRGRRAVREELGIGLETPLVLMVAEFIGRKRHADAVRAVASCSHAGLHLALAGTGPLIDEVKQLAVDLGVDERVHVLGFRRDVPALLAAADVVLLPSEHEGLPRSIMEAMAVGVPVVGTDIRGMRDLLQGGAGVLVPVGEPEAIAEALGRLASNSGERKAIVQRARSRVAEYDQHHLIEMHEELYTLCTQPSSKR